MCLLVLSFLTTVNRGWRLAKPPGGSDEHPVTNWTKAYNVVNKIIDVTISLDCYVS